MTSNGYRSNSVATSMSTSRTTLVENDSKFIANNELPSGDVYKAINDYLPRSLWLARLLATFCAKLSSSTQRIIDKEYVKSETLEGSETGNSLLSWSSPWILLVHVVSNRQDRDKHPITKIAKCTIDTGNMQGNIVSREFLEKVLEFPLSSFQKLTKEEEKGGTSITGDSHIPQGAVYLTWYHKNSTRVFRDMRFLISSTQHCDLIIGARSIQKDKILNVPCLMNNTGVNGEPDKLQQELDRIMYIWDDQWRKVEKKKIPKEEKVEHKSVTPELSKKYKAQADIARWTIELYEISKQGGFRSKTSEEKQNTNNQQNKSASEYWNCIEQEYSHVGDRFHKDIHEYLQKLKDNFGYGTLEMELKSNGGV